MLGSNMYFPSRNPSQSKLYLLTYMQMVRPRPPCLPSSPKPKDRYIRNVGGDNRSLRCGRLEDVSILPGAEEEVTNLGLEKWTIALQKKYNTPEQGRAVLYITYQCYLRGIEQRTSHHLATASRHGYIAGVKLVRGANLSSKPKALTFDTKKDTDANYDACARCCRETANGSIKYLFLQ